MATEQGLARLDPEMGDGLSQEHWLTFTELNGLGRGAVSALAAVGDTVWVGTVFVETLGGQQVQDRRWPLVFQRRGDQLGPYPER